jgi:lipoxygenase
VTGKEKTSIPGDAYYWVTDPIRGHELLLEAIFDVPVSFGPIGAVLVENEVDEKMFLINIVVAPDNNESASVTFEGNSWIKPKSGDTVKHVFFPLKVKIGPIHLYIHITKEIVVLLCTELLIYLFY